MKPFLIYGANGYTGELIARLAVSRGQRPILAGRREEPLKALATTLASEYRVFALDKPSEVEAGLKDIAVVLHCAGPFSRTSRPMIDACIKTGVHYLDVTGEMEVFEAAAARDGEAKAAGVMLLPGVGFDVVPSDCLALHLKRQLPSATSLALGFMTVGGVSHGTATTMLENAHKGGAVRRNGAIVEVPSAWKQRDIEFGQGPKRAVTIPWGDVATAWYSTGIPNIEVYIAVPAAQRIGLVASRSLGWLLAAKPVQRFLQGRIDSGQAGPNEVQRAKGRSLLWGEVTDGAGQRRAARMQGPEGYTLTAMSALATVDKVLTGNVSLGYQTPAKAYGPDFVLEIDGVTRQDVLA